MLLDRTAHYQQKGRNTPNAMLPQIAHLILVALILINVLKLIQKSKWIRFTITHIMPRKTAEVTNCVVLNQRRLSFLFKEDHLLG